MLAGGASRIRGTSGSERPRAAMSAPASLPKEILKSAGRGELHHLLHHLAQWVRAGEGQVRRVSRCWGTMASNGGARLQTVTGC